MATATESALGTIVLAGDLAGGSDPTNPQLTPTGVIPGEYKGPGVVVDAKGRILYARQVGASDVPCATSSSCGTVAIGPDIVSTTVDAHTQISLKKASKTDLGVVKLGAGFSQTCCEIFVDYPAATTTKFGAVIVKPASNFVIDDAGNLSIPTASTSVPGVVKVAVGNGLAYANDTLTFTPSTATVSVKGFVQVGSGFTVASGVVSVPNASASVAGAFRMDGLYFYLNTATGTYSIVRAANSSDIGLIKVGSGLQIDPDGTLNRSYGAAATTTTKGMVQVGTGLSVAAGVLSFPAPDATTSSKGVIVPGTNVLITSGIIRLANAAGTATKGIIGTSSSKLSIVNGLIDFGPSVALIDKQNTFTKHQVVQKVTTTWASSIALDSSLSNTFDVQLAGATTFTLPTNLVPGAQFNIILRQGASTAYSVAFSSEWKFLDAHGITALGPVISTAFGSISLVTVTVLNSNTLICQIARDFT